MVQAVVNSIWSNLDKQKKLLAVLSFLCVYLSFVVCLLFLVVLFQYRQITHCTAILQGVDSTFEQSNSSSSSTLIVHSIVKRQAGNNDDDVICPPGCFKRRRRKKGPSLLKQQTAYGYTRNKAWGDRTIPRTADDFRLVDRQEENAEAGGGSSLDGQHVLFMSQGLRGPPGLRGEPGLRGSPGNPGYPGSPGNPGYPGSPGNPGYPGSPGNPGSRGSPGYPGSPGNPGYPGSPGNPGSPGSPGNPGSPGQPGSRGIPGMPGIRGARGNPGYPGSAGYPGYPGSAGYPGLPGLPGRRGMTGLTGASRPDLLSNSRHDIDNMTYSSYLKTSSSRGDQTPQNSEMVSSRKNAQQLLNQFRLYDHPECKDAVNHRALMEDLKHVGKVSFMILIDLQDNEYCILHS